MAGQLPGVGEDVTALMGGVPDVGDDVTALMVRAEDAPSRGPANDKFDRDFPGLRAITDDFDRKRNEAAPSANAAGLAMLAPGIIPGALVAGGARFIGERMGGKSREDAAGLGMTEGLATGLMGGLTKIPQALGKLGRRAIKGSLKVDRGYLQNMATARKQGLMGAEEELVDTVLAQPGRRNVMTAAGANRVQRRIEGVNDAYNAKVDAAPDVRKPGSGADQVNELRTLLDSGLDATRSEGRQATQGVLDDLVANPKYGAPITAQQLVSGKRTGAGPRDLTPKEMRARIEADNKELRGMWGQQQTPGVEAVKRVKSVNSRNLDEVAGTGPESQQLKKLIDLRNVTNIARRRGEARDMVGITDAVSMSAGRPEVLLVTTAMRPAVQMQIGLTLDKIKRGIPLKGTADERAALQAIVEAMMAPSHGQE